MWRKFLASDYTLAFSIALFILGLMLWFKP
jgi:hypothetical protein